MLAAAFWSTPDRFETLARLALMDRVQAAADTARALKGAPGQRQPSASGKSSRELVARLALQLHLVGEGLRDVDETSRPIEVAVLGRAGA